MKRNRGLLTFMKSIKVSLMPLSLVIVVLVGVCAIENTKAVTWDEKEDVSVYEGELPSSYNLKDHVAMADHYQWPWGSCWSFATIRAIETYLELHNDGLDIDLSRFHPIYMMSRDFGGDINLEYPSEIASDFTQYMLDYNDRGFGAVLETEVPYSNEEYIDENGVTSAVYPYTVDDYDYLYNLKPTAFVTNTINYSKYGSVYTDEELDFIKRHIMENGALYALTSSYDSFYDYDYISRNNFIENRYYDGSITEVPISDFMNHAYSIIGWDDNYPKENFAGSKQPSRDGAFITLNSNVGSDIDGNPVYDVQIGYTSYEDVFISYNTFGISGATTDIQSASLEKKISNQRLYTALKESPSLKKMIVETDDDNQTLWLLPTYQRKITALDLSNHPLDSIAEIGNLFPKLDSIDLSNCTFEGDYLNNIIKVISQKYVDLSYTGITNQDIAALDISEIDTLEIVGNQITSLDNLAGYDMLEVDASNNPITARSLNMLNWSGDELLRLTIDGILATDTQVSAFCHRVRMCEGTSVTAIDNDQTTITIPDELYEAYRKDKYYPDAKLRYDSSVITINWGEKTMTFAPSTNRSYYVDFYSNRRDNQRYVLQKDVKAARTYSISMESNKWHTSDEITFRGNGELSDYTELKLDGVAINTSHYILSYGSTIVKLSPNFFDGVAQDTTHTLTMVWNDGTASIDFTVSADGMVIFGTAQEDEEEEEEDEDEEEEEEDTPVPDTGMNTKFHDGGVSTSRSSENSTAMMYLALPLVLVIIGSLAYAWKKVEK